MTRSRNSTIALCLLMVITGIIFLFPVYWLYLSSFKDIITVNDYPPLFVLPEIHWENYMLVWNRLNFSTAAINSLIVSAVVTICNLFFCTLTGYVFSKKEFSGKKILFVLILSSLLVPPTVKILPVFFIVSKFGLFNTLTGVILPVSVTAFGIFFIKNYIDDVPDELLEAARVDGMHELRLPFTVIFPLISPALTTLALIAFITNWNSFILPLVLLRDREKFTLPIMQSSMVTATDSPNWAHILAGTGLAMIPLLILFVIMQRRFVKSVMGAGIKG